MWCGAIAVPALLSLVSFQDGNAADGASASAVADSDVAVADSAEVAAAAAADAPSASPGPRGKIALATEVIGFDEAGQSDAAARVARALDTEGLDAVNVDVGEACAEAAACVAEHLQGTARALVRVSALRVGGDVEVKDSIFRADGSVVAEETRLLTVAAFLEAPLSPSVVQAIRQQRSSSSATTPESGSSPPSADAGLPLGTIVAVGGGAVAALSLVGFAAEAGTLENPRSLGADKERARVSTWVFLGAAVVGVGAAGAGVMMGLGD